MPDPNDLIRQLAACIKDARDIVDEITAVGDHHGADIWRRISAAAVQLTTNTPPGELH